MKITNTFDLPLPADEAWPVLMDIPRIAPCVPGAELLGRTDDGGYEGKVSVRLGPVALSFTGTAHIVAQDDAARHAEVKAKGSDVKGRGAANATLTFDLKPNGTGGSTAEIVTDVTLTGLVAQYGRGTGVIQSVANEIVGQFAENLRTMLGQGASGKAAGEATGSAAPRPIGGVSLILKVLWQSIRRLWSR